MSSENLDIRARLIAANEMSPAIRQVIADLKKFENVAKNINTQFSNIGRAGIASMAGINRVAQSAAAQVRGIGNANKAASKSYSEDWRKATEQRLSDARNMYRSLELLETRYQRQLDRRIAAETKAQQSASRIRVGSIGRIPAPRLSTLMIGGGVLGAGVASVLKKRMEVQAAEVRGQMFGDLSDSEVKDLRQKYADRLGIRFGVGTTKALDAMVEGAKAGIQKKYLGDFGELSLSAQAGLDIPVEDIAKLGGRLATQLTFTKERFSKIFNAIAVVNNDTAADGKEIVEAMRRGLSALASTHMTPEQLSAITGTEISLGIQPFKAGTFTSFLTSQIAGADSAHGQAAKDLASAANVLGFGGRSGMANMMRNDPVKAIQQILDGLAKLPEKIRTKVAKQIGGRELMDELLTVVLGRDRLKEVLRDVETKQGFLDKTALQKIRSMQGRWASISAAFGLAWERIGSGFETAFNQISDAVIDIAEKFRFDSIKDHFAALIDGLRDGFGLKEWGDVVKSLAYSFDAGSIEKWRSFGKGFAEGVREIGNSLKTAFNAMSFLAGGKDDAEGLGKFIAKLTGLTIALSVLNPALALFASVATALAAFNPFTRMALGLVAVAVGIKRVLNAVSDNIFSIFVNVIDGIKGVAVSMINSVRSWIGLGPIGGGGRGASGSWEEGSVQKQSFLGPSSRAAASFQKASYSGSGGSAGGLDRAAFNRKFSGTALAGKYDQVVAQANANNIPPALLAGVIGHETGNGLVLSGNNPAGLMDSSIGMSRKQQFAFLDDGISAAARSVAKNYRLAGGDLDKMGSRYAPVGAANDPSGLNGGWSSGVRRQMKQLSGGIGSAGIGDAVAIGEKYLGMNENTNTKVLASFMGADVRGRSNAWCARFVNSSLAEAGGKGTGSAVANSFQRWGSAVKAADAKRNDVLLQTHGLGYNQPGGHVGMATGRKRIYNGQLQIEMLAGNDGDSVREHWINADRNLMVRRSIANVPSPAEATKHVPPPTPMTGGFDNAGSRGGNVAIHINGGNHDPEALATLVQRRVYESMRWRTHDYDIAAT